jgi:hypothetical protein
MRDYRTYTVLFFQCPEPVDIRVVEFGRLPASRVPAEYLHRVTSKRLRALKRLPDIPGYRDMTSYSAHYILDFNT